jgi:hypothetical protein
MTKPINHTAAYIAKKLLKLFGPNGEHWTRGAYAKSKTGTIITSDKIATKDAFKFCLAGGLRKMRLSSSTLAKAMNMNIDMFRGMNIDWNAEFPLVKFNDHHRFPAIKKALQKVIAAA